MIYIEPRGGLGNRIRVIASGMWLSDTIGRDLVVVWKQNQELDEAFEVLFKAIPRITLVNYSEKYKNLKSSIQSNGLKRIGAYFINRKIGFDFCLKDPYIRENEQYVIEKVKQTSAIYIQTCEEFGDHLQNYPKFSPSEKILKRINEVCQFFSNDIIGIHIRRTDNIKSIENSPIELFERAMDKEITANSAVKFYLATDDGTVEKRMKEKYLTKIISLEGRKKRSDPNGIQDALVDMYCLSRTSKILGSYFSSYSIVASRFKNISVEIIST